MTDHLYTMAKTFDFLVERIDLKKLSDDELEALSSASDAATADAASLAKVIDSIGCLIDVDLEKSRQGGTMVGSLQGSEIPALLWHLARQVAVIGRVAHVASEAAYQLGQRQTGKGVSDALA
ncbi:hypothetical protein [Burkholderia gladioli]|uniref:Uncharacterized protein n=1 Tax=Burkholderia gladioli TaxID=28095 RepID=A0A2A7S1A9_BURGA|nr:hypothetical protein [Burkholderia gladioli]MBU9424478.1 hypothetical protein [Burkholderia gladioli]MDN8061537.1 hypothetical protein [Burkholderia gladioli]PEH37273.1 hypothetical protein CRM94_22235 [Burkholderia gladioli]QPQ83691.1 hypothetical protein I6H08_00875 [Burkholderia gladioli]